MNNIDNLINFLSAERDMLVMEATDPVVAVVCKLSPSAYEGVWRFIQNLMIVMHIETLPLPLAYKGVLYVEDKETSGFTCQMKVCKNASEVEEFIGE